MHFRGLFHLIIEFMRADHYIAAQFYGNQTSSTRMN